MNWLAILGSLAKVPPTVHTSLSSGWWSLALGQQNRVELTVQIAIKILPTHLSQPSLLIILITLLSYNANPLILSRAKPAGLVTSYHTRGFVEEEKNGCPIRQPFIYKSTLCGVGSRVTTLIIPPTSISFILQAQPVTNSQNSGVLQLFHSILFAFFWF